MYGIAAAAVALLVAVARRYGFHRDELYFLVAGRRPEWGYVDQPPLTPMVARAVDVLPGDVTPLQLRLVPALSVGVLVLLGASLARRFGGGRIAVVFASAAVAGSAFFLATGHLLATSTLDVVLWATLLWLFVMLVDGLDPRWWLGAGAIVGIGMLNKYLIALLAAALIAGLLATPARRLLASPWPWLGAGLAAVIAAPNLIWQATHDWPQLEMAQSLRRGGDGPIEFVLLQPVAVSVVLIVPAAAGFARLWRSRWRAVPMAYAVLFVVFLLSGGTFYYLAPLYVPLLAAGAGWVEELRPRWRSAMVGAAALGVAASLPISLPLLPAEHVGAFNEVNETLGDTMGWPAFVDQVTAVHDALPAADRQGAVILTGNYGEAAALEVLGADRRLPPVMSGHNHYWMWGPVAGDGPIIGVGPVGDTLALVCRDVVEVGTITNPHGIDNEEHGYPLFLCPEPSSALATVWEAIRHYN